MTGSAGGGPLSNGALPDGALSDGALPDGALPDGALSDGALVAMLHGSGWHGPQFEGLALRTARQADVRVPDGGDPDIPGSAETAAGIAAFLAVTR